MTKVSIEEIGGKQYTLIWRDGIKNNRWKEFSTIETEYGYEIISCNRSFATALFALPKHPKPSDAELLYRYASEGLEVYAEFIPKNGNKGVSAFVVEYIRGQDKWKITHATLNGERVEVAIDQLESGDE